jgi:hypothetical protein
MSKEKSRYLDNKKRVMEIYGVDPEDRSFNIHHIIFKSDFQGGGVAESVDKGYMNSKANLIPLPVNEHKRLHERVEDIDQGPRVLYQAPKRKTRKKYRLHDLGRLLKEGRFG